MNLSLQFRTDDSRGTFSISLTNELGEVSEESSGVLELRVRLPPFHLRDEAIPLCRMSVYPFSREVKTDDLLRKELLPLRLRWEVKGSPLRAKRELDCLALDVVVDGLCRMYAEVSKFPLLEVLPQNTLKQPVGFPRIPSFGSPTNSNRGAELISSAKIKRFSLTTTIF